jgi:hypothetical protein
MTKILLSPLFNLQFEICNYQFAVDCRSRIQTLQQTLQQQPHLPHLGHLIDIRLRHDIDA